MLTDLQKSQTFYLHFHRTYENDPKVVYQTIENKFNTGKTIAPSNILFTIQFGSMRAVIFKYACFDFSVSETLEPQNSMLRKFQISNLVKFLSFYVGMSCSRDVN